MHPIHDMGIKMWNGHLACKSNQPGGGDKLTDSWWITDQFDTICDKYRNISL